MSILTLVDFALPICRFFDIKDLGAMMTTSKWWHEHWITFLMEIKESYPNFRDFTIECVKCGFIEGVRHLYAIKPELERILLWQAARMHNVPMLRMLDKNTDYNRTNSVTLSFIFSHEVAADIRTIKFFVEEYSQHGNGDAYSLMLSAVHHRNFEVIEYIIQKSNGFTCMKQLIHYLQNGDIDGLKELMKTCASEELLIYRHSIVVYGNIEIIEALNINLDRIYDIASLAIVVGRDMLNYSRQSMFNRGQLTLDHILSGIGWSIDLEKYDSTNWFIEQIEESLSFDSHLLNAIETIIKCNVEPSFFKLLPHLPTRESNVKHYESIIELAIDNGRRTMVDALIARSPPGLQLVLDGIDNKLVKYVRTAFPNIIKN